MAALRLMTSDLILDEIDGYDPTALLAVLRLVIMSAFFGRNVVTSSATLSKPVANAVWRAYRCGIEMRGALNGGKQDFITLAFDDKTGATSTQSSDITEFESFYKEKVERILESLKKEQCYRIPYLQTITESNEQGFLSSIIKSIGMLHENHHLCDPESGKRISFGLVRMANINPAVVVAKHLSEQLNNARVACYHSQHFPLLRFHIERQLDTLLTRKNGNTHLFTDPEIRQVIDSTAGDDIQFIVVATPVEEIGRDHDFDWAVIEPSSSQSIVQTAGRVNRHRLEFIEKPNISILQFNWKSISNRDSDSKAVFERPGLESSEHLYDSHDLGQLFNWNSLHKIDADMRFGDHAFAKQDDDAITAAIERYLKYLLSEGSHGHMWMCGDLYKHTSLRKQSPRLEITLEEINNQRRMLVKESASRGEGVSRTIEVEETITNSWLHLEDQELLDLAADASISQREGMTASVIGGLEKPPKRHLTFGFYR